MNSNILQEIPETHLGLFSNFRVWKEYYLYCNYEDEIQLKLTIPDWLKLFARSSSSFFSRFTNFRLEYEPSWSQLTEYRPATGDLAWSRDCP